MFLQGEMFRAAATLGGLEIQLVYYRGRSECRASRWLVEADALLALMRKVACAAGPTQIERVLRHALAEAGAGVDAVVFIGDCMEENIDRLAAAAGVLGLAGVPVFLFHEGLDPIADGAFRLVARITWGACCRFDAGSPDELRALLTAVVVYAAGGQKALRDYWHQVGGPVLRLTRQMQS
ncbi:MAG: hypothetical protein FD153_1760 [Rhodospirillaceae bacterium]|nr:MAG: hypothetical protein FD153_1760 [Rhodospirillaceae bacterium]